MWIATPVVFSHPTRSGVQRDAGASGQRRDDGRGEKNAVSQGDAAKLCAGRRRIGLTWGLPRLRQCSLPALNFRSHRDLTEFFNSLLEPETMIF